MYTNGMNNSIMKSSKITIIDFPNSIKFLTLSITMTNKSPNKKTTQIEKDIAYCIDYLELSDNQIGELLRATEKLGDISVEYFCEEFIFECKDDEEIDRLHDNEYLNIAESNALYWE